MKSARNILLALLCLWQYLPAAAQTISVWTGAGDGSDWFDNSNWDNGTPGVNDSAVINAGADVVLSAPTADLASFEMAGGTLTFTNWTTKLTANEITISGGTVTLPPAFTNNAMSNRVWFACDNFTLATSALINTDGKGYAGGTPDTSCMGHGPGGANAQQRGGGYGGKGGNTSGGEPYGQADTPIYPGSGGGSYTTAGAYGGPGGGAVLIEADGLITLDGTITANGISGSAWPGGGSGGGVLLICDTIAGNGTVRADGRTATGSINTGGGGGGRIAVHYNPTAQKQVTPRPNLTFSVKYGLGNAEIRNGELGTCYFTDTYFLTPEMDRISAYLYFEEATEWNTDYLTISGNTELTFPLSFNLTVTNNLTINNNSRMNLGRSKDNGFTGTLNVNGRVILDNAQYRHYFSAFAINPFNISSGIALTNTSELHLYAAPTNEAAGNMCGGILDLSGTSLEIPDTCVIYPYSNATNGGSVKIKVTNLTIHQGGSINADAKGYAGGILEETSRIGYGPGGGDAQKGGGYGGKGGGGGAGSAVYGDPIGPMYPGSGGGGYGSTRGGSGGGLVDIEADRHIELNGEITANGSAGGTYSGAGSGGGVSLVCKSFSGTGVIYANGVSATTSSNTGGGGGGRVAVLYGDRYTENTPEHRIRTSESPDPDFPDLAVEVACGNSGSSIPAEPGTIRFVQILYTPGTIFFFSGF